MSSPSYEPWLQEHALQGAVPACRVEFEYDRDSTTTVCLAFYVPEGMLWCPEGMARVFEVCRREWLGEDDGSDQWATWHLKGVTVLDNDSHVLSSRELWSRPGGGS